MKWIKILILPFLLAGCATQHISLLWKAGDTDTPRLKQVLVVAIIPGNDSVLRSEIESGVAADLQRSGYPSLISTAHFGSTGLAGLDHENTYLKLCNEGIDYVLTIALSTKKQNSTDTRRWSLNTSSYYYHRIWTYQNVFGEAAAGDQFCYESILFDLAELKAVAVLRSRPFVLPASIETTTHFYSHLVQRMKQKKVLDKTGRISPPKPF